MSNKLIGTTQQTIPCNDTAQLASRNWEETKIQSWSKIPNMSDFDDHGLLQKQNDIKLKNISKITVATDLGNVLPSTYDKSENFSQANGPFKYNRSCDQFDHSVPPLPRAYSRNEYPHPMNSIEEATVASRTVNVYDNGLIRNQSNRPLNHFSIKHEKDKENFPPLPKGFIRASDYPQLESTPGFTQKGMQSETTRFNGVHDIKPDFRFFEETTLRDLRQKGPFSEKQDHSGSEVQAQIHKVVAVQILI
jgi:hypothetical protein